MPSSRSAQASRLRLSTEATLILVRDGFGVTVRELCTRLGVPERTFFNHFPTKADVIRPVLERGVRQVADTLASAPDDEPFGESMTAAFRSSLWGEDAEYTKSVVALLLREPALYGVWLSTIRDFERSIARAAGPRLGLAAGSIEEAAICAALVSAVRISFEYFATHDADPAVTFRRALAVTIAR